MWFLANTMWEGGSLGAHKTTFNSAYAGRDSIQNTQNGGKPGTTVLVRLLIEDDKRSVCLFELLHLSKTLLYWTKDPTGWHGGSYQGLDTIARRPSSLVI